MTQSPQKRMDSCPAFYRLLDLTPRASAEQIRRAYRLKSKLYHPDTTVLPAEIAVRKFRELNDVYAILSDPERRRRYDANQSVADPALTDPAAKGSMFQTGSPLKMTSIPYLDLKDRPLSPGEIFALFLLGVTFLGCLVLAIILGLARGEMAIQPPIEPIAHLPQVQSASMPSERTGPGRKPNLASKRAPALNTPQTALGGSRPADPKALLPDNVL